MGMNDELEAAKDAVIAATRGSANGLHPDVLVALKRLDALLYVSPLPSDQTPYQREEWVKCMRWACERDIGRTGREVLEPFIAELLARGGE